MSDEQNGQLIPILTTKLHSPRKRADTIPRPHSVHKLDACLTHKLTLISAPAGFGKTTLATEWAEQIKRSHCQESEAQAEVKVAWLSLDTGDDDPVQFLAYLIAAFQVVALDLGRSAQELLSAPEPPHFKNVLTLLINQIAALSSELVLVLDDYHAIQNQVIHDTLCFLLENSSPQLHLLLCSRTKPPFPLAQLRAKRQLIVLEMNDIRFSEDEAIALLNQTMKLGLAPAEIQRLQAYTEGWVTGLQLSAMAIQRQTPTERTDFIRKFTGQHPYIFDYLGEEVLRSQPPEVRQFLLQTAILERLHPPLCDVVIEADVLAEKQKGAIAWGKPVDPAFPLSNRPNTSQDLLTKLEKANLFVIALDSQRQWYRYHHLFRDFLRSRLHRDYPQVVKNLHQRAAWWYAQQGHYQEAIEHGIIAQTFDWVVQMIEHQGDLMWTHHEMQLLKGWIEQLPLEIRAAHPKLLLLHAWALLIMRQLPLTEKYVGQAKMSLQTQSNPAPDLDGILATIQAALLIYQEDPTQAIPHYQKALTLLPSQTLNWRSAAHIGLGFAYAGLGKLGAANEAFSQAITASLAIGNRYGAVFVTYHLGQLQIKQGRLQAATVTYKYALELAQQGRHEPLLIIAWAYLGLGDILYERNQLGEATAYILKAIKWGKQTGDKTIIGSSYLIFAKIKIALKKWDDATTLVQHALHLAREATAPTLIARVELTQIQLWLAQANLSPIMSWCQTQRFATESQPPSYARLPEYLMLGQIHLAQNELSQAQQLLATLIKITPQDEQGTLLQLWLNQARVLYRQGEQGQVLSLLKKALILGRREGYCRIFLDVGESLIPLLQIALTHVIETAYTTSLLVELGSRQSDIPALDQALLEPLSRAELEILLLLATGLSNQKIAEARVVSITTVKWHLKNIYGKLGVRNRTAAVAQARALNLL